MKNVLKGLVVLLAAAGFAAGQDETIRVATNLVTLNVSVTDRKGRAAKGLTLKDFKLTDNGKPQEIETFSDAGAPVSFGVVYDMHPTNNTDAASVLAATPNASPPAAHHHGSRGCVTWMILRHRTTRA